MKAGRDMMRRTRSFVEAPDTPTSLRRNQEKAREAAAGEARVSAAVMAVAGGGGEEEGSLPRSPSRARNGTSSSEIFKSFLSISTRDEQRPNPYGSSYADEGKDKSNFRCVTVYSCLSLEIQKFNQNL